MKKNIRKNSIAILSVLEVAVLTFIYYMIWRIGYTHGIPGYPEYYGYGRIILMVVYGVLLWILFRLGGCFRFGRIRALSILLTQWGMLLVINIITYLQMSLTAQELVAKRPMLDITLAEFAAVFIFVTVIRLLIRYFPMPDRMLLLGSGIEEGTRVDGYRVCGKLDVRGYSWDRGGFEKELERYDAVLIHGLEDYKEIEILQYCAAAQIPAYVAHTKALIHGVSRGTDGTGMNFLLVRGIGEGSIDGVLDLVKGYLI